MPRANPLTSQPPHSVHSRPACRAQAAPCGVQDRVPTTAKARPQSLAFGHAPKAYNTGGASEICANNLGYRVS